MSSQHEARGVQSPGSYVSFLLANSAQELSQLVQNYLALGQFEAARCAITQLYEVDAEQASSLVYKLIHLQPSVYVSI